MVGKNSFRIGFLVGLFFLSIMIYVIHYLIFRDLHHIAIYSLEDLAFIPLEILFVILVIGKVLNYREKQISEKKTKLLVSLFFSEVGNELITGISMLELNRNQYCNSIKVGEDWTKKQFNQAVRKLQKLKFQVTTNTNLKLLEKIKEFIGNKRDFILNLLENPYLAEHEHFSEMLIALLHLNDEFNIRFSNFSEMIKSDFEHLNNDMQRVYSQLIYEWILYMKNIRIDYPYYYKMLLASHPFCGK